MFDICDQIFETICNLYDQISNKQNEITKQLRRVKRIESYKNLDTNIQGIFRKNYEQFDQLYDISYQRL